MELVTILKPAPPLKSSLTPPSDVTCRTPFFAQRVLSKLTGLIVLHRFDKVAEHFAIPRRTWTSERPTATTSQRAYSSYRLKFPRKNESTGPAIWVLICWDDLTDVLNADPHFFSSATIVSSAERQDNRWFSFSNFTLPSAFFSDVKNRCKLVSRSFDSFVLNTSIYVKHSKKNSNPPPFSRTPLTSTPPSLLHRSHYQLLSSKIVLQRNPRFPSTSQRNYMTVAQSSSSSPTWFAVCSFIFFSSKAFVIDVTCHQESLHFFSCASTVTLRASS